MERFDHQIDCETDFLRDKLNPNFVSTPRRGSHGKPLVAAYVALLLFMLNYFARPEDWLPRFLASATGQNCNYLGIVRSSVVPWANSPEIAT